MAPPRRRNRNRSRKPSMRIDAALAAMRPMGFDDEIVRSCVKKLLKVYENEDGNGDEGWFFIEEASYKLLIETILEGDEEAQPPPPAITGGDGAGTSAADEGKPPSLPLLCGVDDDYDDQIDDISLAEIYEKCKPQEDGSQPQDDPGEALPEPPRLEFAPTPMIMDDAPTKKIRKPCYGWISDDEDDNDDFIFAPSENGAN